MARKIYFYPAQSNNQERIKLKVKKAKKSDNYFPNPVIYHGPNVYDIALL